MCAHCSSSLSLPPPSSKPALDLRVIIAMHGNAGVSRIVEALASHLATEEIAVEGFQLLAKLAAHEDAYAAVNRAKVLDLAYVALFAYAGPQHRHSRVAIKQTMSAFHKCTLYDARELAVRERASRADLVLYALFLISFVLTSALALDDQHRSSDLVLGVQRAFVDAPWPLQSHSESAAGPGRSLHDVHLIDDVWHYVLHPLHDGLFPDRWYNGDLYATDTISPLGVVDRTNVLLGGLQLRLLRVRNVTCDTLQHQPCYPAFSDGTEHTSQLIGSHVTDDVWSPPPSDARHRRFHGKLAAYPSSGYRRFIPRLSLAVATNSSSCGPFCQLAYLQRAEWLDASARALFVEFNVYNPAVGAHCAVTVLFEFPPTGSVVVSSVVTPLHLDPYPGMVFLFAPRFYAELATLGLLAWFALQQCEKLGRYRWFYFVVAGHVADFALVALWLAAIAVRLQLLMQANHLLLVRLAAGDAFVDLSGLVQLVHTERWFLAAASVVMWWRLLRLAKCLRPLERVVDKLDRAHALLRAFAVMLLLCVLGFAHAGVLLRPSPELLDRSFLTSMYGPDESASVVFVHLFTVAVVDSLGGSCPVL